MPAEVVLLELERERARLQLLAVQLLLEHPGKLSTPPAQGRVRAGRLERALLRDAFLGGHALLRRGRRLLPAYAEARRQIASRLALRKEQAELPTPTQQLAARRGAQALTKHPLGHTTDPGELAQRERLEEGCERRALRRKHVLPVGLVHVGGDLREHARGRDAD